jgi:GNAT superfamily N-acetyltransferase
MDEAELVYPVVIHARTWQPCVSVFSAAFLTDPGLQYLCGAASAGYAGRVRAWFAATLRLQAANQQPLLTILDTDATIPIACATLTSPQSALMQTSLLRWIVEVWRGAGVHVLRRTVRHVAHLNSLQPAAPHFRLEFLAVHPARQGRGYGRALLNAIHGLSTVHPACTGVWLETMNPDNVPMYARSGYQVTERMPFGENAEAVVMFRPNLPDSNAHPATGYKIVPECPSFAHTI